MSLQEHYQIRATFVEKDDRDVISEAMIQHTTADGTPHLFQYNLTEHGYQLHSIPYNEDGSYKHKETPFIKEEELMEDILNVIKIHKEGGPKITGIKLKGADGSIYSFNSDTIEKGLATLEAEVINTIPLPSYVMTLSATERKPGRKKGGNEVG